MQAILPVSDGDVIASVPECSHTTRSGSDEDKPKRKKRKLPVSVRVMVESSTEMEVRMVDQACQTELPFASNSPQKLKSIPLADVRHALLHDHSYTRDLSYEHASTPPIGARH